jgi:hypothetical protein
VSLLLLIVFFSLCRAPQILTTAAATAGMMRDGLSTPAASDSEQNTDVVDVPPRCVDLVDLSPCSYLIGGFSGQLCTIRPTDSNKTPAYAPADLRDPETEKPIFLQSHLFSSLFEEPMLSYVL